MDIVNTNLCFVNSSPADDLLAAEAAAWAARAVSLADWVWKYLVTRRDIWGTYGATDGTWTAPMPAARGCCVLTPWRLVRHFRPRGRFDLVGLHSTAPDNTSRWLGL